MYIEKFEGLINQYEENRDQLKELIKEIEELKQNVKDIMPKNNDFRNRHLVDDKIKILTSFYDTIIKMRQEINKSLKEEIELRRKYQEFIEKDNNEWSNMDESDLIRSILKKTKQPEEEEI
jgi:regulator of replication initiation timing